jgi:transcriptional regulator with PAS, ATPase and Fis domain
VHVPPLRERKEDIPQLVANFVHRFNDNLNKDIRGLSTESMNLVFAHNWPGNVRELENVIERSMVMAKGDMIIPEDLPPEFRSQDLNCGAPRAEAGLDRVERDHVRTVLEKCGWNKYKAAKMMGISRSTLYSKIKKHGLEQTATQATAS